MLPINERCERRCAGFLVTATGSSIGFGNSTASEEPRTVGRLSEYRRPGVCGFSSNRADPVCPLPISAGNIVTADRSWHLLCGASILNTHSFSVAQQSVQMTTGSKLPCVANIFYPERDCSPVAALRRIRWPTEWNIKQMAEFCGRSRESCLGRNGIRPSLKMMQVEVRLLEFRYPSRAGLSGPNGIRLNRLATPVAPGTKWLLLRDD